MAYVSQEKKAEIVALAKPILKKYDIKASFAVRNHSTIVCNIKSGKIDLIANFLSTTNSPIYKTQDGLPREGVTCVEDINPYHYQDEFSGKALNFLNELFTALNHKNYNNSDSQIDYFDVGHYIDVNIGKWNKPYILEK